MNKKIISISTIFAFLVTPLMAMAEAVNPLTWVKDIIARLLAYVVWPVFVGAVIIMFIYSGFMFVTAHGDPAKVKSARDTAIWAVVGIIVVIFAYSAFTFIKNIIAPGA